jgi:hypothetical protein
LYCRYTDGTSLDCSATPLLQWQIEGFRSIRETASLKLGWLNVLVGANSAGKSSLIQSILLSAQTMSSVSEKTLLLNGPLVQLGLPLDVVNEESGGKLRFGFSFNPAYTPRQFERDDQGDFVLHADATFGVARSKDDFFLNGLELEVGEAPYSQTLTSVFEFHDQPATSVKKVFRSTGLKGALLDAVVRNRLMPVLLNDPERTQLQIADKPAEDVVAARFRHFFPTYLAETENLNELQLEAITGARIRGYRTPWPPPPRSLRQPRPRNPLELRLSRYGEISRDVTNFLTRYLQDTLPASDFPEIIEGLKGLPREEFISGSPPPVRKTLRDLYTSSWYEAHSSELPFQPTLVRRSVPEPLETLLEAARRFFSGSVRHLGPLREAPRPIYGLPEAAEGLSVGPSGQYTRLS